MMTQLVDDELFDDAVMEFRHQFERFGYYDSVDDPDWRPGVDDLDTATLICERVWVPAGNNMVPSRLWDAGLPQVAGFPR